MRVCYNFFMNFLDKIINYVKEFHMIEEGESVVAGVSGGADSVCLLYFLKEYQRIVPFSLYCVHVEHGIRENANEDAVYVEKLCRQWEIPFFVYHKNVPEIAKKLGVSHEEAGRLVRYEAFEETLNSIDKDGKIAVAHHKNDLAETVLFHLFRGTGLKGMSGIVPVRENVIRPLLCMTREEIEAFLDDLKLSFQTDQTNLTDEYSRNRIRHHVLAYANASINEKATEHIAETAGMIALADEYFSKKAEEYLALYGKIEESGICLMIPQLLKEHILIQKYVIKSCIEKIAGKSKDISEIHVDSVISLFRKTGSKQISLPYEMVAKKEYELLWIKKEDASDTAKLSLAHSFVQRCIINEKNLNIPQKKYTKWFSYDKIKHKCKSQELELKMRTRLAGDYIVIDDLGHTKKLKEYMIEAKIPKQQRDQIELLTIGSEVLWIIGHRINAAYKVTDFTEEILEVQYKEEDNLG